MALANNYMKKPRDYLEKILIILLLPFIVLLALKDWFVYLFFCPFSDSARKLEKRTHEQEMQEYEDEGKTYYN